MESEDSTRFTDSLGQGPTAAALDASKDLSIPSDLEEPINLSVKKPTLVPVVNTSVALQQYRSPKGETQQLALHADYLCPLQRAIMSICVVSHFHTLAAVIMHSRNAVKGGS